MEQSLIHSPVAKVSESRRQMNTDVELSLFISDLAGLAEAESTLTRAHDHLAVLESQLSEFAPASPVYLFNRTLKLGESLKLPESTRKLLSLSLELEKTSDGRFSPWAKSNERDLQSEEFRLEGNTLTRLSSGLHLSFGAIGKGFALDSVADWIESRGYQNWILNAGGSSILFQGHSPHPHRSWKIALSWARSSHHELLGQTWSTHPNHAQRTALGISGMLEQGAHILDPRSRKPKQKTTESASPLLTAVAQVGATASAAEVDALSTALFVDRPISMSPHTPSLLIHADHQLLHTPSWSHWFHPVP